MRGLEKNCMGRGQTLSSVDGRTSRLYERIGQVGNSSRETNIYIYTYLVLLLKLFKSVYNNNKCARFGIKGNTHLAWGNSLQKCTSNLAAKLRCKNLVLKITFFFKMRKKSQLGQLYKHRCN